MKLKQWSGSRWPVLGAGMLVAACSGKLVVDHGTSAAHEGPDGGSETGNGGATGTAGAGGSSGSEGGRSSVGGKDGKGGAIALGGASNGGTLSEGGAPPVGEAGASPFLCSGDGTVGAGGGPGVLATRHWPGNGDGCPASPPERQAPCETAKQRCAYDLAATGGEGPGWYVCLGKDLTHLVWYQYSAGGNEPSCPKEQPAQGAPCVLPDAGSLQCGYPSDVGCQCVPDGDSHVWDCRDYPRRELSPPAKPDDTRRVRDLTSAERRQWCEWYACLGATLPVAINPGPLTPDGYTTNNDCTGHDGEPGASIVASSLPVDYCVGNLELSDCEATVAELNDCVLPDPVVGFSNCGPYLAQPGCSGTIAIADRDYNGGRGGATAWGPGPAMDCPLKVR